MVGERLVSVSDRRHLRSLKRLEMKTIVNLHP